MAYSVSTVFVIFTLIAVQLLHKFSVRATETSIKLLKVIRNPVTDHLPVGCRKLNTSFSSAKLVDPRDLVPENEPMVFVVGAMAHGQVSLFTSHRVDNRNIAGLTVFNRRWKLITQKIPFRSVTILYRQH